MINSVRPATLFCFKAAAEEEKVRHIHIFRRSYFCSTARAEHCTAPSGNGVANRELSPLLYFFAEGGEEGIFRRYFFAAVISLVEEKEKKDEL
jgi:hypothetical protein